MGLYDERLADLSEPRHRRRVARSGPPLTAPAHRHGPHGSFGRNPMLKPGVERSYPRPSRPAPPPARPRESAPIVHARKPAMDVQSLLFSRADGWTVSKAKAWAKSHGYKHSKSDVTDQYIRIRQFDPKGVKVKRTITFGRGIRAVVAREVQEERMAKSTQEARRKRRKYSSPRRRRRRTREVAAVAEARRRPRRRRRRAREAPAAAVAAPRRRRRRALTVMEGARRPRRRRRRSSRRRRRT